MSNSDASRPRQQALDAVERELDQALLAALRETSDVPTQDRVAKRRWFGMSMLVLALVCMVVAAVPWPAKAPIDLAMWAGFAIVLLVIGAWHLDKAAKEAQRSRELLSTLPVSAATRKVGADIRRVK